MDICTATAGDGKTGGPVRTLSTEKKNCAWMRWMQRRKIAMRKTGIVHITLY
jgi:hypothetical protein